MAIMLASAMPSPSFGQDLGPLPDIIVFMQNEASNTGNGLRCLLMKRGASSLYDCLPYLDQAWYIIQDLTAPYRQGYLMANLASGKCLAAPDKSEGARIVERDCDFDDIAQKWTWRYKTLPDTSSGYQISNLWSGRCLLGKYGARNAPITQFRCLNYADQLWGIEKFPL